MGPSSFLKAQCFAASYCQPRADGPLRVIDVGSMSYLDQETHRVLFPPPKYEYVGLDLEQGPNVDIVVRGYVWSEIPSGSFDVALSGQTFEHNPFFWVTFCEMARVLKPGGYMLVIAPGAGTVHRYPYDCWRFYPDAWLGLCRLSGLALVESYFERDSLVRHIDGAKWRESAVVARKPNMNPDEAQVFDARLSKLAESYSALPFDIGTPVDEIGPCFQNYEACVRDIAGKRPLRRKLHRIWHNFLHPLKLGWEP